MFWNSTGRDPLDRFLRTRLTLALIAAAWTSVAVAAAPGDVKRSMPAPCSYPTGLATDGKNLYVADWRTAMLFAVDAASGEVVNKWSAPTLRPRGLAWADGKLYVSDDHTGRVYAFDPRTEMSVQAFEAPGREAAGLAFAHGSLFILEVKSGRIYEVLPEDGTILRSFPVPDENCVDLAHDGQHLWVTNRNADEIYMVDERSGTVISVLESPGPYPAGLAWLDGHLWNVDFQEDKFYEIVIDADPRYRVLAPRESRVEYLWSVANYGPGTVEDLAVWAAVPQNLPNQQLLSEVSWSVEPTRRAKDKWGQLCGVFELGSVPAGERQVMSYTVDARISALRWLILPEKAGTLADIPADLRAQYTVDGARYRLDSEFTRATLRKVVGDEKNCYWIARKIFNYLIENIEYEMAGGWDVPEAVLQRGKGSCSEYTFCFVALCRAAGLPARYQGAIVVRDDEASVDEAFHRWAEVYLPNHGWIPVDPSRGDKPSPVEQAKAFGQLANHFLITTHSGGDSELLRWSYNSYACYKCVGYCNVSEENFGFWEPLGSAPTQRKTDRSPGARDCRP